MAYATRAHAVATFGAVVAAGCTIIPGYPRYVRDRPAAIAKNGPPRDPAEVRLVFPPIGMFTILSSGRNFRIAIASRPLPSEMRLEPLGDVRTEDASVDGETYAVLEADYRARGAGEPGSGMPPREMHPRVTMLLAELRERAAAAGANVVDDVKCFAMEPTHLWCEGRAALSKRSLPVDEAAPESHSHLAAARTVIAATADAAGYGSKAALGASLVVRHRPVEVALEPIWFPQSEATGIGVDLRLRRRLVPGVDVFLGGGASYVQPSTMTVRAVGGIGVQPRSQGVGVMLDLDGGYAFVPTQGMSGPERIVAGALVQLRVGLIWPELP